MVTHILKDGTKLKDIRGHIVKIDQAKTAYSLLDRINRKVSKVTEKAG